MSPDQIVRAWKDADYGACLGPDAGTSLPANPVGPIELADAARISPAAALPSPRSTSRRSAAARDSRSREMRFHGWLPVLHGALPHDRRGREQPCASGRTRRTRTPDGAPNGAPSLTAVLLHDGHALRSVVARRAHARGACGGAPRPYTSNRRGRDAAFQPAGSLACTAAIQRRATAFHRPASPRRPPHRS